MYMHISCFDPRYTESESRFKLWPKWATAALRPISRLSLRLSVCGWFIKALGVCPEVIQMLHNNKHLLNSYIPETHEHFNPKLTTQRQRVPMTPATLCRSPNQKCNVIHRLLYSSLSDLKSFTSTPCLTEIVTYRFWQHHCHHISSVS